MAYEKTNWQTGDVITAAKLNNMEGGIEDANLITDKKTFIYNLTHDQQTGTFSIEIDETSPVPTVDDFEHPERNQVKLVAINQFLGIGYLVLFLPFSLISSLAVTGDEPNYRYSRTGALGSNIADFAVQFYVSQGEVVADVYVAISTSE